MTFLHPSFLILLVVAVLPWFIGRRDGWHALLRSLVMIFLVLALARPAMLRQDTDRAYHVYVHESEATAWVEERLTDETTSAVAVSGSLSEALEEASGRIPHESRGSVTVVSTGHSADPHWGQAVRQFQEREIPVHTVGLAPAEGESFKILDVQVPKSLRVGQEGTLIVELLSVPEMQEIQLVDLESQKVLASHFAPQFMERLSLPLRFEPPRAGFLRLAVRSGEEEVIHTVAVEDPLRALYLGERMQESDGAMQRLLGSGVSLTSSDSVPDLEGYDLVMIDDLPATRLPDADQEKILTNVSERGMGLFMSGGMAAFGPGGYDQTPIAKSLPVEFMQKEEKRDPSTTLAVIIDTSGSMGGERVQLAKEVTRLAIRRLLPHDKVGIVEFYGTKQWAAPIQSAANAIDIQRAINRLDAGGGTVIMPAIEEAYYALQNVKTRYKHVLVLTDGGVEAGEFEPLLRKMAGKGMNVSTVLVGGDAHSEFLVNIANWGKGHFYSASNRFSIPEILLKQPSTSKIPAYRPGTHSVTGRGGPGWWGSVNQSVVPDLAGYVETRLRDGAEVLLETSANKHPIAATWKVGLGRVTTFATEPTGKGTKPWEEWTDYGPWLARVLARTAREERQPFKFEVERRRHEVMVRAEKLVEGETLPVVEWFGNETLEMQRRSPAIFTATIVVDPTEEVRLLGGTAASQTKVPLVSRALEDTTMDPDKGIDLALLSEETGGQHLDFKDAASFQPAAGGSESSLRVARLWNLCLLLALLFYFADILYRRWPTRELS